MAYLSLSLHAHLESHQLHKMQHETEFINLATAPVGPIGRMRIVATSTSVTGGIEREEKQAIFPTCLSGLPHGVLKPFFQPVDASMGPSTLQAVKGAPSADGSGAHSLCIILCFLQLFCTSGSMVFSDVLLSALGFILPRLTLP